MNRFTGYLSVVVLGMAMAWAQAPAAGTQSTTGQPAPAQTTNPQTPGTQPSSAGAAQQNASSSAQQTSVAGCMTQRFGIFTVNDTSNSKSWQIKAPGTSLYNDANQMVTVKGLEDPKAPSPTLYAQNVQTTGQQCGNAQATNGAQPGAAASGQTGTTANGPANPSGAVAGSAETQSGTTGTNATTSTTGATGATGTSESNGATTPQTGSSAAGPGASPTTQPNENKGVPSSGTPTNTPPQSSPQK